MSVPAASGTSLQLSRRIASFALLAGVLIGLVGLTVLAQGESNGPALAAAADAAAQVAPPAIGPAVPVRNTLAAAIYGVHGPLRGGQPSFVTVAPGTGATGLVVSIATDPNGAGAWQTVPPALKQNYLDTVLDRVGAQEAGAALLVRVVLPDANTPNQRMLSSAKQEQGSRIRSYSQDERIWSPSVAW